MLVLVNTSAPVNQQQKGYERNYFKCREILSLFNQAKGEKAHGHKGTWPRLRLDER
jgi:hypothetical protein